MNIRETSLIVGLVAEGDNRKVDERTIAYWHDLIGDLRFVDAQQAVREFRRESTEWLQPAHVRQRVKRIRASRLEAAGPLVPAVDADDPNYFRELRRLRDAVADGQDLKQIGA